MSTRTQPSGASADAPGDADVAQRLHWPAVVTVLAGLAAAWIAAGATGLLANPLRGALTWSAMAAALLAGRIFKDRSPLAILILLAGAAVAAVMSVWLAPPVRVLGVAVLLGVLSAGRTDAGQKAIAASALAVGALGVWRLACASIPMLWLAADRAGGLMGSAAGLVTGKPLWVGATFGGLDFLVAMLAFHVAWLFATRGWRRMRAVWATVAIVVGHLVYLIVLTHAADLGEALRVALLEAKPEPDRETLTALLAAVRPLVPWNIPALAGAIHLVIVAAMCRWSPWPTEQTKTRFCADWPWPWLRPAAWGVTVLLAVALPVVTTLSPSHAGLEGKKIVAYEEGFLNWEKPKHDDYGRLSIGMYGMLPEYLASLGATFVKSPELSAEDLEGADVLILLYPDKPWTDEQRERIKNFVTNGGSLLVMGEHTVREPVDENGKPIDFGDAQLPRDHRHFGDSRFNEILESTAMRVRFDSATFEVGGWLQCYDTLAHPTTAGIPDDRNQFGVVIGASLDARLPARPLLVGRWGWADPGDIGGSAMMGNHRYDAGEKLGDLVLVAEQPLGDGTVVAFGDTSSMTNGITMGSHPFTSRLLAYLANRPVTGHAIWRQCVGLVLAAAMLAGLFYRADPLRVAAAAVAMAAALTVCVCITSRTATAQVLPDGGRRAGKPNNLAYIDSSHMEAASEESWRPDGTMGLAMTLIRNGYLTLSLPELTADRLSRAGLLVSIAPAREFSKRERQVIREFVEAGGVFICTVGYDRRGPSEALLDDFGFRIGDPDHPHEPQPMGHFKSPYLRLDNQGRMAYVRFHAGWPVTCTAPKDKVRVIAYGRGNIPIIVRRNVGDGKVVVIGDTGFAMNKNLERRGGEAFEGMRENADFWRWLIPRLTDRPEWNPSPPATQPATQPATRPTTQTQPSEEARP